jgi:SAM-dependent methyltransferase
VIWIIFSQIGVLHHITDPKPSVEAAYKALRPGGHFLVWLYGKEGDNLSSMTSLTHHMQNTILAWRQKNYFQMGSLKIFKFTIATDTVGR